jgi:fatty-acyl-CoA synthase
MHGTGLFGAIIQLLHGGTLITMPTAKFDPNQTIDTIRDQQALQLVIVGDAFAKPLIERLEEREDAAEAISSLSYIGSSGTIFEDAAEAISSLSYIGSSGTIFSLDIKERFIALNPGLIIADALGSSESAGTAICITTAAGTTGGGTFAAVPGRETKVFDEDLQELAAGDEKFGILARSGPLPLGYLGEDEKNAKTFPVIDGVRYLLTGDFARFRGDGSIEFKGRDNMCINSGGEKIFPEEVEATLMAHPEVADVRVVGVPDDRFGNKVTAVVRAERSGTDLESQLDDFARQNIASYKVPRLYVFTDESLRLNNGKPDYRTAQALADSAA